MIKKLGLKLRLKLRLLKEQAVFWYSTKRHPFRFSTSHTPPEWAGLPLFYVHWLAYGYDGREHGEGCAIPLAVTRPDGYVRYGHASDWWPHAYSLSQLAEKLVGPNRRLVGWGVFDPTTGKPTRIEFK
jgi:hypothetical protein